jgi:hypothetical protein
VYSNLPSRIHYLDIRHRNGLPIDENREIRSARQMEHDNLYCSRVVSALVDMDANNRLANVQSMLRQPYLVPHAIRPSNARYFMRSCLSLSASGRYHQYPIDENFQNGPQRACFSFTYVLLPHGNIITLCK